MTERKRAEWGPGTTVAIAAVGGAALATVALWLSNRQRQGYLEDRTRNRLRLRPAHPVVPGAATVVMES